MDSSAKIWAPVLVFHEHGNEPFGSIKGGGKLLD
jgi:hypothetical protein